MALLLIVLIIRRAAGAERRLAARRCSWGLPAARSPWSARRACSSCPRSRSCSCSAAASCLRPCALLGCAVFLVPWNLWVSAHAADDSCRCCSASTARMTRGSRTPFAQHGAPFVRDVVVRNLRALYGMVWVMFTGGEASPKPLHIPAAICAATVLGRRRVAARAPRAGDGVVPRRVHGARDRVAVRADAIRLGAAADLRRDARARHRVRGRAVAGIAGPARGRVVRRSRPARCSSRASRSTT